MVPAFAMLAALQSPAAVGVAATLDLGTVELPGVALRGIHAEFRWDENHRLHLVLAADELAVEGQHYRDLRLACAEAQWSLRHVRCDDGSLGVAGAPAAQVLDGFMFEYRLDSGEFLIQARAADLGGGKADIQADGDASAWRAEIAAKGVQTTALAPLLTALQLWPEGYSDFTGALEVVAKASFADGQLHEATLKLATDDLGFTGTHIAQGADISARVGIARREGQLDLEVAAELTAGALYVEPGVTTGGYRPGVTFEAVDLPVTIMSRARYDAATSVLRIEKAVLEQPNVASIILSGGIQLAGAARAEDVRVEISSADLKQLYAAHIKQHCVHIVVLCGLEFEGTMDANVRWDEDGMQDLALRFHDVYADDERNRFRVAALDGDLRLESGAEPVESALRWESAGWYRLEFGAGSVSMLSSNRGLSVTRWSDLALLDGVFKVDALDIENAGSADLRVTMSGVLTPVSMQGFSHAMGWPIMSGTLSGAIPGVSYRNGLLILTGDLEVQIFGGKVTVQGLRIQDPFDRMPVLTTDVELQEIDLQQLTGAFSFGEIQGTLEGEVNDLRLEDWAPVAFDAWLRTAPGDDVPHRISQKAVDNLSAIGGGGIGGALSRGFLRLFKDYSYAELGLSCRLENGICAMAGVTPAEDGFYIVTRGGIFPPWIDVKGSGRRLPDGRFGIAWNDVLLGLNRINSGQMELQ